MAGGCPAPALSFAFEERVAACDLCGGADFRTLDAAAQVDECRRCGFRFANPRPAQAAIATAYSDPHAYDHWLAEEAGRREMWRKRLEVIERYAPQRGRLLDVGAGIGTFLGLARERGWEVAGTEVSRSAANLAATRHGLTLELGQVEEAGLPVGSFDAVTLWHVLEHVPSPAAALEACRRLLRQGGLLVIASPNDSDAMLAPRAVKRLLTRVPFRRYEPLRPGEEVHLSHFRPAVLRRALAARGFQVLRLTVDDHYPRPTALTGARVLATRLAARASGVNLGNSLLAVARKLP